MRTTGGAFLSVAGLALVMFGLFMVLWIGTGALMGSHAVAERRPLMRLSGVWEQVAGDPHAPRLGIVSAVQLPSGEIAVFHSGDSRRGPCLSLFSPGIEEWTAPSLAGDPLHNDGRRCFYDADVFVVGPDGRLYSPYWTIDPVDVPWLVEASNRWMLVTPEWDDLTMAISTNGLAHLRQERGGSTRLADIDLLSGAVASWSSWVEGINWWPIAGPSERIYLIQSMAGKLVSYDPGDDSWRVESDRAPDYVDVNLMAFGPDSRIYIFQSYGEGLFAWDPALGEWLSVELPVEVEGRRWWGAPVAAADGRLYLFDGRLGSYAFTPGAVVPQPHPDPAPTSPDTAARRVRGADASLLLSITVFLLGTAATAASISRARSFPRAR